MEHSQEMRSPARRRACILRQGNWYGPEIRREAEALAGAGFDVEVVIMRAADASRHKAVKAPRREVVNGVTVIRLPVRQRSNMAGTFLVNYGLYTLCVAGFLSMRHIRRPYAVVQANSMPDFLVFAALVPKLLGARVVAYMQEPVPELAETIGGRKWLTGFLARIEQWSIRFADHSVTVTEQLKQRYVERGAPAGRITVVLNCPDPSAVLENWSPPPPESKSGFVAVCHGTIEDRYGQDTIIDAVGILRDELPDLRLVITGRGSRAKELADAIADRKLQDVVQFEGWVSQTRLNDILSSADVGIVAQKASPYSHLVHTNKMVDYWIFGLPVIASRLHAVSELYDDRFIEYYEPGDATDLAAAIRRLHADTARRAELAQNGKLAQLRNGWATQRVVYLDVFNALLGDVATQAPGKPAAAGSTPDPLSTR
jgi:glycosyltransferase involved in cell wall biosynthesis